MSLIQCYNKGCGAKYDPENNASECCTYHPGEPIFHDAKKSWSCCKKYSTDFSEFLNIKGCAVGMHSNVRLSEAKSEPVTYKSDEVKEETSPEFEPEPLDPMPVPADPGPLHSLAVQISPGLTNALAKEREVSDNKIIAGDAVTEPNDSLSTTDIKVGTKCKNNGCSAFFTHDIGMKNDVCRYHPGIAVFHEGMKYWSCCHVRTSDFEKFTKQRGCCYGHHVWKNPVPSDPSKTVSCRYDWFQFSKEITVTIYSKLVRPDSLSVTADRMTVNVSFKFGPAELQECTQTIHLFGLIDPLNSHVKALPTKLEIILKKSGSTSWARLERDPPKPIITWSNIDEVENREEHVCWHHDC